MALLYRIMLYLTSKNCNVSENRAKKSHPTGGFGGLEGIRTLDPHNANVVRSQLRYKPVSR